MGNERSLCYLHPLYASCLCDMTEEQSWKARADTNHGVKNGFSTQSWNRGRRQSFFTGVARLDLMAI